MRRPRIRATVRTDANTITNLLIHIHKSIDLNEWNSRINKLMHYGLLKQENSRMHMTLWQAHLNFNHTLIENQNMTIIDIDSILKKIINENQMYLNRLILNPINGEYKILGTRKFLAKMYLIND